jgi:1-deoxy-D-xylulose-5-phosphate reductoisomerase
MKRRIAILGSTGSIGTSALDVVDTLSDTLQIVALSSHSRTDLLIEQVERYRPAYAAVTGDEPTADQRRRIEALGTTLLLGSAGLCEIARQSEVETVLLAVVGAAGVRVAMTSVALGKTLALANKETLVVAGSVLMPLARQTGATILPVDSEHSAIFQCLRSGRRSEVARVILTASGGPFRNVPLQQMRQATVADALKHPTWSMGAKVTIDSATMFNKALEIIEAAWLFDLSEEQIAVVVHPQSVVHSMVEFVDGSVIAQLSPPDMRTPIQYALTYPDRVAGRVDRMDWTKGASYDFAAPDLERFPSLRMGMDVVRQGGTSGAVLNAANEIAVQALQAGQIRLGMIYQVVERTMQSHRFQPTPSLDDLLEADRWARDHAAGLIRESSKVS